MDFRCNMYFNSCCRDLSKGLPDYSTVSREHSLLERGAVMGAKRAGRVDLVAQAREQDLAVLLKVDLFPVGESS